METPRTPPFFAREIAAEMRRKTGEEKETPPDVDCPVVP